MQPNVLLVMADQLAPHFTGAYEHPLVLTRAMEALVERGARFDAAYCPSPLCAPSRFAMLTGQPVSAIGAWDNASELPASVPTFAHYLRIAGYRTALSGKMHFVGPDQMHGFEQRLTTDIYPADFGWTPDWNASQSWINDWYNSIEFLPEAGQALATYQIDYDEEVGVAAVRHLYDLARDTDERPFFLAVSFTHPHDPYVARPEWWNLYDHDDIDLPDAAPPRGMDPHTLRLRQGIGADRPGYTEALSRNARHAYYANTSYFDSWVGNLVRVLDETGRLDDTVVIVTADHGDMLGDRGVWFKRCFFERSARVPFIMAGPDIADRTVPNACSLLDLLPTLLDIAAGGGPWPEQATPPAGRSLWESATGGGGPADEATAEYMGAMVSDPMYMIRRGTHKYIHCDSDPPLLYDVASDPMERNNLAVDPAHTGLVSAFAAEVTRRWDSAAIRERVLAYQRTRRVLNSALTIGEPHHWDYSPPRDAANEYVRNHMDWAEAGPRSRFPRI